MAEDIFARYILPVASGLLENGIISISEERIDRITASSDLHASVNRRGQHLIIPGLVNAHTHLDLTDMAGAAGRGEPFTGWIKKVIAWRKRLSDDETKLSINNGIALSLKNGTTCFGDYSSSGASFLPVNKAGLKGRVFLEVTGLNEDAASERISELETRLSFLKQFSSPLPGVAPHAPYSVSPGLIRSCASIAGKEGIPLSMHAGEVTEETEFLYGKGGDMEKLLRSLNVWEARFKVPFKGAVEYLHSLGVLEGMALVHLNFITSDEVQLLKKAGCSAIFCPGSHLWFKRSKNTTITSMVDSGVNVALGSDGLSSNNSLNMFREMRLMNKMFPQISRNEILKMATINGAMALSLDHVAGSLKPGKDADLVGIECPESVSNPLDLLFDESVSVKFVMVKGKIVYGSLK